MALESQDAKAEHQNIAHEVRLLAEALSNTHRLVALTGAGISTESGIPDYRSPNGIWSKQAPTYYSDFVRNPAVRRRYWARSLNGYRRFRDAQPNIGHHALALMEKAGRLHYLITQNVDRLHTKAGSQRVVELHGENSTVHCTDCDYREPRTQTQERLEWENRHLRLPADETGDAVDVKTPICPVCGGLVKPGVVFFGEPVPADLTSKAFDLIDEAGALLIVGSSLTVWSGYRLARAAREQGKPLYILNIGPTRADEEATLKIEAPAGETLRAIAEEMGLSIRGF